MTEHPFTGLEKSKSERSSIRIDAARHLLRTWLIPIVVLAAAFWLVASPILDSPYWGDDMKNSQMPMEFALDNPSVSDWIVTNTKNWTRDTGRFFPLSVVQSTVVFTTFTDRASYKAYQFAFVGLTLGIAALLMGVVLRTRWAAFASFGLMLPAVQLRSWYDPFWQFHGLQELVASAALLSTLCAVIAVRRSTRWAVTLWAIAAAVSLAIAALTYESSVFLAGVTLLLILRERASLRRRFAIAGAVSITAMGILANLFYWRSQAVVTNPAYVISLTPWRVRETLQEQMLAAVPLSYGWFTRQTLLPDNPTFPAPLWIAIPILVAYIAVVARSAVLAGRCRTQRKWLVACAALVFWGVPSFFVAISSRWQDELTLGLGYIPVLFGTVAFGWLAMLIIVAATESMRSGIGRDVLPARIRSRVCAGFATLVAFAAAAVLLTVGISNYAAVRFPNFVDLQSQRDGYARAVQTGLYDTVPPDSTIVRPVPDWWYWVNTPFTAWYGGPSTIRFVTPEEAAAGACAETACFDLVETRDAGGAFAYDVRSR